MTRSFFILLAATFSFCACSENTKTESGLDLPDNVIEQVEERYPDQDGKSPLKKAVYIDTLTHEKVAERHFYESKKVYIENLFKNGKRNGPSMAFRDSSGIPWSLHTYVNDTLDGPYKVWHENGSLRIEGQYRMGKKIGNWRFLGEQGEILREVNFDSPANQAPQ